jgi:hypothetical protein
MGRWLGNACSDVGIEPFAFANCCAQFPAVNQAYESAKRLRNVSREEALEQIVLSQALAGDWKSAAWMLDHISPKDDKLQTNISIHNSVVSQSTTEALKQISERNAKLVADYEQRKQLKN